MQPISELRSLDELSKSIRNFDNWIGDSVSGGMDVDFLVERKGNFLFVEGKPWQHGVALRFGQHLTLRRLSQQPFTTVLLVGEDPPDLYLYEFDNRLPNVSSWAKPADGAPVKGKLTAFYWPTMFFKTDVNGLRKYVEVWWEVASRASY